MPFLFKEPLKAFRFLVDVESNGKKIVAAFAQFSGVKMRVETVSIRDGSETRGVMDDIPALTSFETVSLTKGVIGDNEFLNWILAVAPGPNSGPTGIDMYRSLNIVALNDRGQRAVTWTLLTAIPVAYELGPMDSSKNAVLTETIEFAIGGFQRETHMPDLH